MNQNPRLSDIFLAVEAAIEFALKLSSMKTRLGALEYSVARLQNELKQLQERLAAFTAPIGDAARISEFSRTVGPDSRPEAPFVRIGQEPKT